MSPPLSSMNDKNINHRDLMTGFGDYLVYNPPLYILAGIGPFGAIPARSGSPLSRPRPQDHGVQYITFMGLVMVAVSAIEI